LIHQKDNSIHAADMSKHDHGDIAPKDHDWEKPVTNGYISHSKHPDTGEDQYHMSAYRADDNFDFHRDDDHPVIKKMLDNGIQKGNLINGPGVQTAGSRVRPQRDTDNPRHFEVKEGTIVKPLREISKERVASYRDAADKDWSDQGDKAQIANDKISSLKAPNLTARMNAYQDRTAAMQRMKRRDKGMAMADRKSSRDDGDHEFR
jgi:hypothetical protein